MIILKPEMRYYRRPDSIRHMSFLNFLLYQYGLIRYFTPDLDNFSLGHDPTKHLILLQINGKNNDIYITDRTDVFVYHNSIK